MKFLLFTLFFFNNYILWAQLDPDFVKYKDLGDSNYSNHRYWSAKKAFEVALNIKLNDDYCLKQLQKCKYEITEAAERERKSQQIINQKPIVVESNLKLELRTNKGINNILYLENETMKIAFKVSEPCYLRLVYRMADDKLVLLRNDYKVTTTEVNHWVELPQDFVCAAPFGTENLLAYASKKEFPPVNIEKIGEYRFINEELSDVIDKSQSKKSKGQTAEKRITIITQENYIKE
jgi:hypothetical protein